jgi:hypothetical protein
MLPSVDFEEWAFLRRRHNREPVWWVVMLINTNNGGHTQLHKTTEPDKLLERLPIQDNDKEWHEGMFIRISADARAADAFIQLVSGSFQSDEVESKQIRGIISRAAMADRLSTHFKLRCYGNFNNIFCLDNAEELLSKQPLMVD